MAENLAFFTEPLGKRIRTAVETVEKQSAPSTAPNDARLLVGHTSPVEIIDGWILLGETWVCRARRLFRIDGTYQPLDDGVEFDLYHPTALEQPALGFGERAFAVNRGVWELVTGIGGGGGATSARVTLVQPLELMTAKEYKTETEHYILIPGGRTAEGVNQYIFSFNLLTETWQATVFPTLQKAVYCADQEITEVTFPATEYDPNPVSMQWMTVASGLDEDQEYNRLQIIDLTNKERRSAFSTRIGSLLDAANFAGRPLIPLRDASSGNITENSVHLIGGSASSIGTKDGVGGVYGQGIGGGFGSQIAAQLEFNFFLNLEQMTASVPRQNTIVQNAGTIPTWNTTKIINMVDTLNTMARGFYRRCEVGGKRVDYIQIGGRTRATDSQSIVSFRIMAVGMPNSTLPIADSNDNNSQVHTYTQIPIPLNECCVEHYLPTDTNDDLYDKAIIVGGRASTSNNSTVPHYHGHLWNPSGNNNAGEFEKNCIPRMPHPRWNAASVIIYDLPPLFPKRVYKDEYEFVPLDGGGTIRLPIIDDTMPPDNETADRMFIIGGRNENGLVAEVDVFNLRTFKWEADWKGLDQGELETYTPAGGGGTTIVIGGGGGSSGVQSVRAGTNVTITGDNKNPVISAVLMWD